MACQNTAGEGPYFVKASTIISRRMLDNFKQLNFVVCWVIKMILSFSHYSGVLDFFILAL